MTDRHLAVEAWESLFRAQHVVFAEITTDFSDDTLTGPEYDVLLTVSRGEGRSAPLREVTANMLISQPSVSRLVDRMVSRGLVTKTADPCDGRGYILTATDAGATLFRATAAAHARTIASRMAGLTDPELRTLLELTRKLRDAG